MSKNYPHWIRIAAALWMACVFQVNAQERLCPDGKRSYFGVCPDDGNNSRPVPAPKPATPAPTTASMPVSLTVPFAPGGPTDGIARAITQSLGAQALVDNKPGNFGITALQAFVQTPREGAAYYVLTASTLQGLKFTNQTGLIQHIEPVALIGIQGFVVLVPAARPIKSLQELVAASRGKRLTAGTTGEGGLPELCLKQLSQALGIAMDLIPYRGVAPVLLDLGEGHMDISCLPLSSLSNEAMRAKVSPLAMTANVPNTLYPNVPALESLGLKGVMKGDWFALVQNKRTDAAASAAVLGEIQKISVRSDFRARVGQLQFTPFNGDAMTPAVARNFIYGELQ